MYSSTQIAAFRAKEWVRGIVRQVLLSIGIASVLVYLLEPTIDGHAAFLPITVGTIGMCVFFGIPAGLALWVAYRILRFAIGSPAALTRHNRPFRRRAL